MEGYIECEGFIFFNDFDSSNLDKVEKFEDNNIDKSKKKNKIYQNISPNSCIEFNIWTKHDCHGTEFQNNNKTWFYFGVKAPKPNLLVKLNLVNLNKHVKMFSQGMSPVYKDVPGHRQWSRIKDKPTFIADDQTNQFLLTFNYTTLENTSVVRYFAFTYPFSYSDLQNYLKKIDTKMMENLKKKHVNSLADDNIYYHRECAIKSLEGRRLDVLTISSYYNILTDRETKIKDLFDVEKNKERPFKFKDKKIIFVSARVHPGETPSSFVLNGLLKLLLNQDDEIAIILRRLYVFKLIPMLNPDGVARGCYRTDTKGINLNRLYLNPSLENHPTIYAAKALLRYYHKSYYLQENVMNVETTSSSGGQILMPAAAASVSGIFLYVDLHGHASKKGIFMYGNYFDNQEDSLACMLLPKLMSINNSNFHFTSCNFAEKNMYLIDKRDGMTREGSGRVAVHKLFGLVYSYTLECNYNTGRLVNNVPARLKEKKIHSHQIYVPPKYNPLVFEEVGAAFGPSILDMTGHNPNSRLPNSHYRSLKGLVSYLNLITTHKIQPASSNKKKKN